MILNKKEIKLVTQLLGNRIAELQRQVGLYDAFEIKRNHHKYLVLELELAESMLDKIINPKLYNKSKTAIDWLISKIVYGGEIDYTSYSVFLKEHINRLEVFNKAKNIERENIESAYEDGFHAGCVIGSLGNLPEQYYEDNYNSINYIDEPTKQKSVVKKNI